MIYYENILCYLFNLYTPKCLFIMVNSLKTFMDKNMPILYLHRRDN